jgi:hypothetical protein
MNVKAGDLYTLSKHGEVFTRTGVRICYGPTVVLALACAPSPIRRWWVLTSHGVGFVWEPDIASLVSATDCRSNAAASTVK